MTELNQETHSVLINQAVIGQIDTERFKAGHIRQIMPLLNKLSETIKTIIISIEGATRVNIQNALVKINTEISKVFNQVEKVSVVAFSDFVFIERQEEKKNLASNYDIPEETKEEEKSSVSPILSSLVMGASFQRHLGILERQLKERIRREVKNGFKDNLSTAEVSRSIRGTRSRRFKDGAFNTYLNHLSALINTTIQSYYQAARISVWKATGVKRYIWISVLDNRTTAICRGRSNKVYDVGNGPTPPAHYRCRSTIAPYFQGMEVPTDYSTWLRDQPKDVIEDVLGKGKAKLFLSNQISLDKFTANGRELTLDELREKLK